MQNASFYAYLNTGIAVAQPNNNPVTYAMINTGVYTTNTGVQSSYSYLNLGLPIPEQRTVTHGPRGWGILPVEQHQFTVFTEESKGKTYAYVNTTS